MVVTNCKLTLMFRKSMAMCGYSISTSDWWIVNATLHICRSSHILELLTTARYHKTGVLYSVHTLYIPIPVFCCHWCLCTFSWFLGVSWTTSTRLECWVKCAPQRTLVISREHTMLWVNLVRRVFQKGTFLLFLTHLSIMEIYIPLQLARYNITPRAAHLLQLSKI